MQSRQSEQITPSGRSTQGVNITASYRTLLSRKAQETHEKDIEATATQLAEDSKVTFVLVCQLILLLVSGKMAWT